MIRQPSGSRGADCAPAASTIELTGARALADDVKHRGEAAVADLGQCSVQEGAADARSTAAPGDKEHRDLGEAVGAATGRLSPLDRHPTTSQFGDRDVTHYNVALDSHPGGELARSDDELLSRIGEWPTLRVGRRRLLGTEQGDESGQICGAAFTDRHGHNLHGMPRGCRRIIPVVTAQPTIGVLAVQGDVREHVHALELAGARTISIRRASELETVDGLVIPGGESTTMDKLVRIFDLYDPLVERLRGGLPAYGSCAGMIMLADRILDGHREQRTLGGLDITVRRNAFGRQVDSFEEDLRIRELGPEPVRAVFIRAPWVEDVGEDVQVLASVHVGGVDRPVAVRQDNLLATSFHPEVTGDHRIHAFFAEMVRRA